MTRASAEAAQRAGCGPGLEAASVWDVLDRFGQHLQSCEQVGQQIDLILTSLLEGLGADAVFWYPGRSSEKVEVKGSLPLDRSWCEELARCVLTGVKDDVEELVMAFLDPGSKPIAPWPCSVALVRVSRSRGSWMVALSFHPRRIFEPHDTKVMRVARRMLLSHRQQGQVYERLRDSLLGLVRCLTATIDAKDPYTWGHSERVGRIAVRLGRQMHLPGNLLSDLYLAGLLHDIGKIGVRDSVLQKAGPLDEEEQAHIREHPLIGDRLVSNIKALQHLRPGIRSHHERYDGQGYPDGLARDNIPLLARILAVSDACDAMMAARPYRNALPPEKIDGIMSRGAGTQWDPQIVEHFLQCRQELYSICQRGLGDSVFVAVERALRAGHGAESTSVLLPHP